MKSLGIYILTTLLTVPCLAGWGVDFSRRQENLMDREKQRRIASEKKEGFLEKIIERQAPMQEIVIMHGENGFSPSTLQVKKDQRYKVHIVNVDRKSKNVSFMLDAFSQHHGTFFGEPVAFVIEPRQEGMYDFQCPETEAKGRLVVTGIKSNIDNPLQRIELRQPANKE